MLLGGCHFDRISSMLVEYLTHCCISVCRGVDETRRKRWVKGTLPSAVCVWGGGWFHRFDLPWVMLNSPQSPYFTNALKPWLDFLLNKTSQDKSGASLGWGWWGWGGGRRRLRLSLVLVCSCNVSPFHPHNQPPLTRAEPKRLSQYVT